MLDTDFGLVVKFDGVHHIEITVPGDYFNKVLNWTCVCPPCFIVLLCSSKAFPEAHFYICKHTFIFPVPLLFHYRCVVCAVTTMESPLMIT